MQIYAINGSPRQKWNTATILQHVLDGAAEAEPDVLTETINLYEYSYKGCISCMECKRIGSPSYGKCVVKDTIAPVMQNVLHADIVVFGSPIYFSSVTGMMRCFLERLLFPNFVYDKEHTSIAPKKLRSAFVYTMNVPKDDLNKYHYPMMLGIMEDLAGRIFGHKPRNLYVNDTLQVKDYSKYRLDMFSAEEKKQQHELEFPLDCKHAESLGAALV